MRSAIAVLVVASAIILVVDTNPVGSRWSSDLHTSVHGLYPFCSWRNTPFWILRAWHLVAIPTKPCATCYGG